MESESDELSSIIDFINHNKSSISLVLQTGDMTNNNSEEQWNNVFFSYINRLPYDIPHYECLGNHDYGEDGSSNSRTTQMPKSIFNNFVESKGEYNENYISFVEIGNVIYGILVLEFGTRDFIIEWADEQLKKYSNISFIILTHAFLNKHGDLYCFENNNIELGNPLTYKLTTSQDNDSSKLCDKLINNHKNIKMIISGHCLPPKGYLYHTLQNKTHKTKLITINFQHFANGGDGNIAALNFRNDSIIMYIISTKQNRIIHTEVL